MTDRKQRPPIDWDEAKRLYAREGLTYADVARTLGADYTAIRKGLLARGVRRHKRGVQNSGKQAARLYRVWQGMRNRCTNPGASGFEYFGAKGIRVCREWETFRPFYDWALRSGYRRGRVLTLIRRDKNYSPSNCAWISRSEASRRMLRRAGNPSHWTITAFGETKGPTEWSQDPRCRVCLATLVRRIDAGMSPKKALTLPPRTVKGAGSKPIAAFGEVKSLNAWAEDPRCSISTTSLRHRLERGFPPERAIAAPPRTCKGGPGRRRR